MSVNKIIKQIESKIFLIKKHRKYINIEEELFTFPVVKMSSFKKKNTKARILKRYRYALKKVSAMIKILFQGISINNIMSSLTKLNPELTNLTMKKPKYFLSLISKKISANDLKLFDITSKIKNGHIHEKENIQKLDESYLKFFADDEMKNSI